MYSETASFLHDRPPLPPWGTLEAIEVPGYPQSHLRVPLPEHRDAFAALVRAELSDPETPTQKHTKAHESLGPPVSLEQSETENLILYLHEDAWGRGGVIAGCLGLWRTEEERQAGIARIGAFITHKLSRQLLKGAIRGLIIQGQERWGWSAMDEIVWAPISYNDTLMKTSLLLPLPTLTERLDLYGETVTPPFESERSDPGLLGLGYDMRHAKGIMKNRHYPWEGARRFYSSPSGALTSEWYDESHRLHEALDKDMSLCEEGVLVNAHYNLSELRAFIMPHLQNAIKRGVSVVVSMTDADLSPEPGVDTSYAQAIAHELEKMGATVVARPSRGMHNKRLIIDRRIFWALAQGLPDGYMTRTIAEKQIPLSLTRDRRIV